MGVSNRYDCDFCMRKNIHHTNAHVMRVDGMGDVLEHLSFYLVQYDGHSSISPVICRTCSDVLKEAVQKMLDRGRWSEEVLNRDKWGARGGIV